MLTKLKLAQGTIETWQTDTRVAESMFPAGSTILTRILFTLTDYCIW